MLWTSFEKTQQRPSTHFGLIIPASTSGILPDHELQDLKSTMSEEAYEAEFECNVHAVKHGRILLPYINTNQIQPIPYDPYAGPVITAWDLGMSDTTSIWACQIAGTQIRLIWCYENSGQGLSHYVEELKKQPFNRAFGAHLLPHDSRVRELGTGISRIEVLRNLGMRNMLVVPRLPKDQQIEATRMMLPRCWFDATHTIAGLRALRNYSFAFDKKRKVFSPQPKHDEHSNFADSAQQLAVGLKKASALIGELNSLANFDPFANDDQPDAYMGESFNPLSGIDPGITGSDRAPQWEPPQEF
jgi:hypothetical protein